MIYAFVLVLVLVLVLVRSVNADFAGNFNPRMALFGQ
jgi:hypothetical protein